MKKKPSKRKTKRTKHRTPTGMGDERFLWYYHRRLHYQLPRNRDGYQGMSVVKLIDRVSNDIDELLARANPKATAEKEPGQVFLFANEGVANEIHPGLWKKMLEQAKTNNREAINEYGAGLADILTREPKHAVKGLVFFSTRIATYLEHLAAVEPELMRSIASESDLWPLNLGLKKDKNGRPMLRRVTFAKDYLARLDLCSHPKFRHREESGAVPESPFRVAAKALYNEMVDWKRSWDIGAFNIKTPWVKRLGALKRPMTRKNAPQWWRIAQEYLVERWERAPQEEFGPLIKHLGLKLDARTPYSSNIRTRVIDNDLKDAFLALAGVD